MAKKKLYGGETAKAVANFPISGEPVPVSVVHWLGRIKGAAARVNGELGLLDPQLAKRISAAAHQGAARNHHDPFPHDLFPNRAGPASDMHPDQGNPTRGQGG